MDIWVARIWLSSNYLWKNIYNLQSTWRVLTGGQWKCGHRYMKNTHRWAVEEWTQIYEKCLQEDSGSVDTDTWRALTGGQWKSGHRYMKSAYRRTVEVWTQIHEECLAEGSGRVDTNIWREDTDTWTVLIGRYRRALNVTSRQHSLLETSTDDTPPSTGHPN